MRTPDPYAVVMDPSLNPLRKLPPAQRFQTMVYLSVMWTTIFCAGTGAWFWFGELITLHLLVALGALITTATFKTVGKSNTYRDHPAQDGTARYDDVWGA